MPFRPALLATVSAQRRVWPLPSHRKELCAFQGAMCVTLCTRVPALNQSWVKPGRPNPQIHLKCLKRRLSRAKVAAHASRHPSALVPHLHWRNLLLSMQGIRSSATSSRCRAQCSTSQESELKRNRHYVTPAFTLQTSHLSWSASQFLALSSAYRPYLLAPEHP
jgi:hypothetical protein